MGRYAVVCLLLWGGAWPAWAQSTADALAVLKREGGLILLRHAVTEPGTGDPPGFRPDDCSTQRNLSADGRAQASRFGNMLAAQGIRPVAVFSSRWCRCMDTARLVFPSPPVRHWAALDSLFMDNSREAAQTAELRAALPRLPAGAVTVWVTHNTNVTALANQFIGMGEALALQPDGKGGLRVLGRLSVPAP